MTFLAYMRASAQVLKISTLLLEKGVVNSMTVITNCGAKCFSSIAIRDGAAILLPLNTDDKIATALRDYNACEAQKPVFEKPSFNKF